ncbi:hypothetical protein XA68_14261 [Ophiocordyceps unilateralis]|uniref:Protein kinase domain-containing protein n=1 Tax=Ophiocordyceps unilateralis TaxID=268505 RepID=A0A2A9P9C3_OPHUN|nr:hypothetical protein XA68_14261 [Ophiocordyceps unilateralis]
MDSSFMPMAGIQMSLQRRLTRLYSDTKKSTDFVREPLRNDDDPGIKTLHRKLRIQKDRLVSWGLEWSDSAQSADIDNSLSRAGLSDVVASVMSTIKDILAEAEALWLASKSLVDQPRPSLDRKLPLVRWDKARFEDLVRDLTVSIETLYDLSRSRSCATASRCLSMAGHKASDDSRPFESSRVQTPRHVDPHCLTRLKPLKPWDGEPARHVALMAKGAYSDLARGASAEPLSPLLLEYAAFDPIYATTGIMPDMARFERLSAGLQQDPQCAPGTWTGLPRLLGYFEDVENARLGLVYRFPPSFHVLPCDGLSESSLYNLPTLRDLLSRPQSEPPLEAKFRLAFNLVNTVFDMHARGITHGNLDDQNISFSLDLSHEQECIDVRYPLVSSFDLFPDGSTAASPSFWRYSKDSRRGQCFPLNKPTDERLLELYSLAMALLSIGLWTKLDSLAPEFVSSDTRGSLLHRLAVKCGGLYVKATQACWRAVEDEASGSTTGEALLSAVQVRVTRCLEICCLLDGVSGLEWRLRLELQKDDAEIREATEKSTVTGSFAYVTPVGDRKRAFTAPEPVATRPTGKVDTAERRAHGIYGPIQETADKLETKMRLYPHVPLAPDVVDRWNTTLMPQINHALRHFYRKHPESVEVSLESVGPSPNKAQPTAMIVCTSVGKVRAILKKRLTELFDGTAGIGVRVCRGHVIRSRRQAKSVAPASRPESVSGCSSRGGEGEDAAANSDYQERPGNGASIGAWIGYRHLPPVSFGGLVLVDGQPYGMTVHHMVDEPDQDFGHDETLRSGAAADQRWCSALVDEDGAADDLGLSEAESEPYSGSDVTSDYGQDDDEADDEFEPGDVPGIEPDCGDGYLVTQPALDDVRDDFYPCAETRNEDHNDSFHLGKVFASSGIRRKRVGGLIHEVDWALFEFSDGRLPNDNRIPRALDDILPGDNVPGHLRPTSVAPSSSLPGMQVQCAARTSGIQTGQILPALTTVKIYGRTSPSHTYEVASSHVDKGAGRSLGIPGDSGAWVVDRHSGQLCGHILAWSQRKRVAYICPMDVLLLDVADRVDAAEVRLPGGGPVVTFRDVDSHDSKGEAKELIVSAKERCDEHVQKRNSMSGMPRLDVSHRDTSSLIDLGQSGELEAFATKMEDLSIGRGRRIGVS